MSDAVKASLITAFAAKLQAEIAGMNAFNQNRESQGYAQGYGEECYTECVHRMTKAVGALISGEELDWKQELLS